MYILIHVVSQTEAGRIMKMLESNAIYASVRKTPFFISHTGCGFAVRIKHSELERAMSVLKRHKASYKGIYEVLGEEARRIDA
ncbi:MAG: DUF3343 domain-containing protein [Clostridia bacterium]|nr:DUF3343 domain-containing protein [Clostridia bacterium]